MHNWSFGSSIALHKMFNTNTPHLNFPEDHPLWLLDQLTALGLKNNENLPCILVLKTEGPWRWIPPELYSSAISNQPSIQWVFDSSGNDSQFCFWQSPPGSLTKACSKRAAWIYLKRCKEGFVWFLEDPLYQANNGAIRNGFQNAWPPFQKWWY